MDLFFRQQISAGSILNPNLPCGLFFLTQLCPQTVGGGIWFSPLARTNTIGFSFDITEVESEIAALKFIKDKYEKVLTTGTVDPAVEVPKLIEEAKAAGIDKVVAEAQRQFDAFLAGK